MKRGFGAVAVTALLIGAGVLVWTQSSGERSPLGALQSSSDEPLTIQMDQGVPRFMRGEVQVEGATPAERSYAFLERHSKLYALEAPQQELEVAQVESSPGTDHVRLQQHEGEIEVYGGELVVHMAGNDVVSTGGTYLADVPELEPKVEAAEALATAREAAGIVKGGDAKPELTYFDADLLMTPAEQDASGLDAETHLAWLVDLDGAGGKGEHISWRAFVDALTGELILGYSRHQSHTANKDIWIRSAGSTGGGWFCTHPSAVDWFDENGAFPNVTPDTEGNNAWAFAHQIYNYFYNTFHRHSFDGADQTIRLILDVVDTRPGAVGAGGNAQYVTACNHFVFNNNMATLDIVAHEVMHGVTEYAVPGGLEYLFQSGALNESYSDVFAAQIDTANWTIGEPNALRDVSNPPAFGDPDTMPPVMFAANRDFGGVHTNSGIPNKAGFLLMQGGFHNGRIVAAIGRAKAAQLHLEVLDNWLTKTSNFQDFRNYMVSAASVWSIVGRHGFTAADLCRVVNTFGAVAIGPGNADCDGQLDDADADDDNDTDRKSVV